MEEDVLNRIHNYSLEEIMGDRFGRYAKAIIQDRAIPDVRDGLKPVQRRILYGMFKDRNTYDKPYRKSAKTVGYIMGNYHPHGDSSIYEAMVRMSQWWKQNTTYIDMHGNNGSMDGDSAAAMRYTEARLSKISNELLKDIDKSTVAWAPNFDDTELEPTVLPAKFPNLLVNGSTGISAGYATNIPPHNLGEVIDATIKRIDNPNCHLDTIMDLIKGPDFPTGGVVEGLSGIRDAFETGRGKITVRSKTEFTKEKGKEQIIITEIPFDVNKAMMVKKIDEIRIDKKIDGILEVRDETDRDGLRIAIDLKKDAPKELILNYLLKNTDLQISYNYNMVAIVNRCPKTLGLLEMLDAYIAHQREVITKRTQFDLQTARNEMHIVEGLVKAISILDEVIATIRASKNKSDAKDNLVKKFDFTERQAEAIVTLQLYRLTNTDVTILEEKLKNLALIIKALEAVLADPERLKSVMKDELKQIKKEYATPRKTVISSEVTEIKIDTTAMLPKEDVMVVVTHEGYVKRTSLRSYQASDGVETGVKEQDYVIGKFNMNTMDTLLIFTSLGNYLFIPIYELPDLKWKDLGKHVSNIVKIESEDEVVSAIPIYDFKKKEYITLFTRDGMVKRTNLEDYLVTRYSKPLVAIKLKEKDQLVAALKSCKKEVFISTHMGYGLWYDVEEIPLSGTKTSGVKAISLKNDYVVSAHLFDGSIEYVTVITEKNTAKRIKITEFDKSSRARRGLVLVREVKTNPYHILKTFMLPTRAVLGIKTKDDIVYHKITEYPIVDRYGTGSSISKTPILDAFIKSDVISKEEEEVEIEMVDIHKDFVSLKEVDERIMTIDDFLDDFEKKK